MLRLHLSMFGAGGGGSNSGQGAKIPYATQSKNRNMKQKHYCNKFNKDFKNGSHKKKFFLIEHYNFS